MNSKMKVLQVIPKLGYGGAETGCYDLAHYLPENNCQSYLITSGGPLLKYIKKDRVKLFRLPVHSKNPLLMILNFFFITFIILFFINVGWLTSNLYLTITGEIESFVKGTNPIESIYYSSYLKWILLIDVLWLLTALFFMIQRKNYKTDAKLHYLNHKPILNPKICVVLPAYNEAEAIAEVVRNFQKNKFNDKLRQTLPR